MLKLWATLSRYVWILILVIGSVSISHASDKWQPVIDFEAKLGSSRDLGTTRAMVPLRQSEDGLLFGDVRFTKDSLGNHEYNVGAGLRQQMSTNTGHRFIIGGYGFYDFRRSDNNVNHQQITIGGELLTTNWDFRANVYHPLTGAEVVDQEPGPSVALADQQLLLDPGNGQTIEDPLHGFDVEVGRKLPFYNPVSLFGAYYNFDSSQAEQVEGYRIRGEWELNDYLTMTAEHSQDGVRDDTQFIGLRLRLPLQRLTAGDDTDRPALTGLDDRMMEPVIRDVDIVTGTTEDPGDAPAPLQRADSSGPARVIYVDNSNDGDPAEDGSATHPFNTLQEGIDAAGAYDTVYIRAGDGTATGYTPATTYTITKSMRIIGEGAALTLNPDFVRAPDGTSLNPFDGQILLEKAGQAPLLDDSVVGNNFLESFGNELIEVRGLKFDEIDSGWGLDIRDFKGAHVSDLEFTSVIGSSPRAISLAQLTSSSFANSNTTVRNIIADLDDDGQLVQLFTNLDGGEFTADLSGIHGVSTPSHSSPFIRIDNFGDSNIDANLRDSSFDGFSAVGGQILVGPGGTDLTVNIDNIRLLDGDRGIAIVPQDNAGKIEVMVENTDFINHDRDAFLSRQQPGVNPGVQTIIDLGGGSLGSAGNNRFISNNIDIRTNLVNDIPVNAQNNWWGSDSDPSISNDPSFASCGTNICHDSGESVDFSNRLTSDPRP